MAAFEHLDIRALPEDWSARHFGDLVSFRIGRTPPRNQKRFWANGRHPWVSIADMQPFGTVCQTAECVSEVAHEEIFRGALVPANSLLMSFKLTIGRVAKLGVPAYHNEAIISFRPDPAEVDPEYLFYHLPQINYRDYQDTAVKGQTLNKGKIESLEIALPQLPEQRKIASVLGLVQRSIDQQQRLIEKTAELKETLLHHLFTKGLRGERRKETEIGLVPESWEVVRLGVLIRIKHGYAFAGELFKDRGSYILCTPGHFYEGGGFRDQGEKTKYYVGDFPAEYLLKKGDLLLAMTEQAEGLLGSAAFIPESNRYLHNQRLGLVHGVDESRICKEFLYYLLNTPLVRNRISMTASGSKVRHTSPRNMAGC